jgi:gas vesicle protein|tara:strand:+ start:7063 stop:7245 length:183 start_codon:yes stop_codon:yes gene_type:complete
MGKSNNIEKVLGAAAVGALIGGALGILFAPAKGSKTRKNILGKGEELKNAVKDKYNSIVG